MGQVGQSRLEPQDTPRPALKNGDVPVHDGHEVSRARIPGHGCDGTAQDEAQCHNEANHPQRDPPGKRARRPRRPRRPRRRRAHIFAAALQRLCHRPAAVVDDYRLDRRGVIDLLECPKRQEQAG